MNAGGDESFGALGHPEATIDLETAGWKPGNACPECGHPTVRAIVRIGMSFHDDGAWELDERLQIYEAFCPVCDWLPPIQRQ